MEKNTKGCGLMIRPMDTVFFRNWMERNLKVIGLIISKMEKVRKLVRMVKNTRANFLGGKSMDLGNIFGRMDLSIWETGWKIKWRGKEPIHGVMVEFTLDFGSKTL